MEVAVKYPLIPIRNTVVFPGTLISLVIGRNRSVEALKRAKAQNLPIIVAAQKIFSEEDPRPDDIYRIGTLCSIESMRYGQDKSYQVVVRGLSRFRIGEIEQSGNFLMVTGETVSDAPVGDPIRVKALLLNLKSLAKEIFSFLSDMPGTEIHTAIDQLEDPSHVANLVTTYLNISTAQKQELLEEVVIEQRVEKLLTILLKERDVLKLQKQIHDKMSEHLTKAQRQALLREQLRTIKEELGEEDGGHVAEDLEKKIENANMPPDVLKVVKEEWERLKSTPAQSSEYHVIRNYLEYVVDMPWSKSTKDAIDLNEARKILDADHYGLDEVKKRILQFLAVAKLKNDLRGPILCLLGPPGVGKTSLGHSIAKVLGREFIRASLGGIRDEAEIRGHRRTYVGAMPGRIIQGIKRAGTKNPVFMLDEIDKLGVSYQGDPASSLLEVLDPEQNKSFIDHYLDVPFDLSGVFFVATANVLDTIPRPLLDRMEIIELTGYTALEKRHIARNYLVPKQLKDHGLTEQQVTISDEVIDKVISSYTREAGVRDLQRQLASVCRWIAQKIVEGHKPPFVLKPQDLSDILGVERFLPEVSERAVRSGVATGLAWTPHGGDILFIEASLMKGTGRLILTGHLGDIMKESAQIAMSFIRAASPQWRPNLDFEAHDIHIHVPSGAIPKDGPSAGVTILAALSSLISGRVLNPKLAMTGEITLRGAVLPVGGIKEKVLAAHRAGIETILLPRLNQKDILQIPEDVRNQLKIVFVSTADDVISYSLNLHLEKTPSPQKENQMALAQ